MSIRSTPVVTALAIVVGLGIGLVALQGRTQGSAEAGAGKAAVCLACHGMNGNSTTPEWPRLAGQQAAYIERQLKLFREGERTDPLMSPMAINLSDEDIKDLAAYYAAQTPTGLEADPSYWQAGQKLYRGGDPARGIPGCIACHGPAGKGNPPAGYPTLRAQHAVYTQKQLQAYAAGTRPGDQAAIMTTISKRLTAEDIRNLASYIQGLR